MMTHPIHLHGMWSDLEDDAGPVPGAQAHHRHAAGQPAQLSRHRRRAGPLGVSLPPAVPHGSRACSAKCASRKADVVTSGRAVVAIACCAGACSCRAGAWRSTAAAAAGSARRPRAAGAGRAPHPDAPAATPPALPPFIPPVTDADRAAAFPDVARAQRPRRRRPRLRAVRSARVAAPAATSPALSWDVEGWIGGDRDRLWFRTEGVGDDGRLDEAQAHVLYGRADRALVGRRRRRPPGRAARAPRRRGRRSASRAWRRTGSTSRPPATSAATAARSSALDAAHDLLLTRRLVAQTLLEADDRRQGRPGARAGRGADGHASSASGSATRSAAISRPTSASPGTARTSARRITTAHHGEPVATGRAVIGLRVWR